jgi:hypothetical protein
MSVQSYDDCGQCGGDGENWTMMNPPNVFVSVPLTDSGTFLVSEMGVLGVSASNQHLQKTKRSVHVVMLDGLGLEIVAVPRSLGILP